MKNRRKKWLGVLACAASLAFATVARTNEAPANPESLSQQELAALEQFLRLSDEQLDRIQQAVARVRAMSAEERKAHAEEIVRFRDLPPDERSRIRDRWGWQNARDRDDWRTMMQALSPEERQKVHEKMQSLPPGERTAYRVEILEQWRQQRQG
jgi:hypothetical protein